MVEKSEKNNNKSNNKLSNQEISQLSIKEVKNKLRSGQGIGDISTKENIIEGKDKMEEKYKNPNISNISNSKKKKRRDDTNSKNDKEKNAFICPYCDKNFTTLRSASRHSKLCRLEKPTLTLLISLPLQFIQAFDPTKFHNLVCDLKKEDTTFNLKNVNKIDFEEKDKLE